MGTELLDEEWKATPPFRPTGINIGRETILATPQETDDNVKRVKLACLGHQALQILHRTTPTDPELVKLMAEVQAVLDAS